MSILLETTFGDLVIDLDVDGSPALCKNILKLAKARYYTNTLIYNVVPGKYCQMGGEFRAYNTHQLKFMCINLCLLIRLSLLSLMYIVNYHPITLDPKGDGTGGCSIHGLIDSYKKSAGTSSNASSSKYPPDVTQSQRRFLQSQGRVLSSPQELNKKGVVIAMEMGNVQHTIGSQFLFTLSEDNGLNEFLLGDNNEGNTGKANTTNSNPRYLSLGTITEDSQNILSKLNRAYCDDEGRPFADVRIERALVLHDPFEDPEGMDDLLKWRGVSSSTDGSSDDILKDGYPLAPNSPTYDRPPEEKVPVRIQADDTTLFATAGWDDENGREYEDDDEEDEAARQKRLQLQEKQEEEWRQRQDTSRAVMLEMLGDRPTAEIEAPEDVLFVCKLNPLTNDEDLELIFSRFDQQAKAEIIRDPDTGVSLQYAFVEFTTNEACNEAYLKMNNALVDDRRIRVDFSQSVAKVWDRYHKQYRRGDRSGMDRSFMDGGGRGRGGRGHGRGQGRGRGGGRGHNNGGNRNDRSDGRPRGNYDQRVPSRHGYDGDRVGMNEPEFDSFGRHVRPKGSNGGQNNRNRPSHSRSPSRENAREERRRRSRSGEQRHSSRHRNRSRSNSSDYSRHKKKHQRHERERKRKKHKQNKHHRSHREYSDDEEEERKRRKKHRHRHRDRDDSDRHRRRRDSRSRSRSV